VAASTKPSLTGSGISTVRNFKPWLDASRLAIATPWEVLIWGAVFVAFFAARHWLEAMVVAGIAVIDAAVLGLSWLVSLADGEGAFAAFASTHVFGAVLLYGFLAVASLRMGRSLALPFVVACGALVAGGAPGPRTRRTHRRDPPRSRCDGGRDRGPRARGRGQLPVGHVLFPRLKSNESPASH